MEPNTIRAIGIGIALPAAILISIILLICINKYVNYKIKKERKNNRE